MEPMEMPPQEGMTGQPPMDNSLAGPPPGEAVDPMGEGVTDKQQFEEIIMQIPIDQLIQLVQGTSPEELGQAIQKLCVEQLGMDPDEAVSFSITLMKVINERIQDETGKPITEFTGQGSQGAEAAPVENSLAGPPVAPPAGPPPGPPPMEV